jgi:hypothetical protein
MKETTVKRKNALITVLTMEIVRIMENANAISDFMEMIVRSVNAQVIVTLQMVLVIFHRENASAMSVLRDCSAKRRNVKIIALVMENVL